MKRADLTRSLLLISMAAAIVVGILDRDPKVFILLGILAASFALVLLADQYKRKQDAAETNGLPIGLLTLYRRNQAAFGLPGDSPEVLFLEGGLVEGLLPGVAHRCWVRGKALHIFPAAPTADSLHLYPRAGRYGAILPLSRVAGFDRAARGEQHTRLHLLPPGENTLVFSRDALLVFRQMLPEKEGLES